eukprot:CAMPEP_0197528132 /NCGR_PEP_ID=MMETSP1318-20131121/23975_1 /TAXON_ID=552666 /ORGANISM="Partenskyella glossopodia, Strain RCC365" /LENGTH=242 /DNA_ID=CAMNT_0043083095 /DNA_START=49 /DNA_END=777 /DNA_ORIENTATION=+
MPVAAVTSVVGAILLTLASLRTGLGLYAWRSANMLEKPQYSVISTINGVELRHYKPYLVAEVKSKSPDMKKALSSGFRQVAGYVFGKNKAWQGLFSRRKPIKMKMTAPVRTTMKESTSETKPYTVSFPMGSDFTWSNLPIPDNRNVTLRMIPGHFLAVKKFSGPPPTEEKVKKFRDQIVKVLAGTGLKIPYWKKDETVLYQYHDPFATPNILRRNEVGVELSPATAAKYVYDKAQKLKKSLE